MLQTVLDNCIEWQNDASSTLHAVACFLNTEIPDNVIASGLVAEVKQQVIVLESFIKAGLSLGLDFCEIPKLQNACSTLRWCFKALSFCSVVPQLEVTYVYFILVIAMDEFDASFPLLTGTCVIEFSFFSRG